MDQLPILQVIVPLVTAPLCLVVPRARWAWLLAFAACLASLLTSAALLHQVLASGEAIYEIGGWPAPWGIAYRIDGLSAFLLLIVSAIGALVLLSGHRALTHEIAPSKQRIFYVAYLLCVGGQLGIVATGDLFNVFVFLEISSLASYILIALASGRRSLLASYQYLIPGTIGATFILMGIGLLYAMTGTLNMQDLAERLPELTNSRSVFSAFVLLLIGCALKLALFPLHQWLPGAYTYAPSPVSALLAATATKVAFYLMVRLLYSVFGVDYAFAGDLLPWTLYLLAIAGIFVASILAIRQENVKRMLAYSSVAQVGYLVLGLALNSVAALSASLMHLFNHALMKSTLFLALGVVTLRVGGSCLKDLAGLGRQMPWTVATLVIGGASLIGMPFTAGFISKWHLVEAALEQDRWLTAVLVLASSLLAVVYVGRMIETACFRRAPTGTPERVREVPSIALAPVWLLAAANLYFGLDTRLTAGVSIQIARDLYGLAP